MVCDPVLGGGCKPIRGFLHVAFKADVCKVIYSVGGYYYMLVGSQPFIQLISITIHLGLWVDGYKYIDGRMEGG